MPPPCCQASPTAPSSSTPPREDLQGPIQWVVATAVRTMDTIDRWWECWKEMKRMEDLAHERTNMAEDLRVCKNCMLSELRNAVDVVRLEDNDEECARILDQSKP